MPEARRAVITQFDGHNYAVLVDALEDVAPFEHRPIDNGLALRGGWAAAAAGLIERDGEPVLVLDLTRIVPAFRRPIASPLNVPLTLDRYNAGAGTKESRST